MERRTLVPCLLTLTLWVSLAAAEDKFSIWFPTHGYHWEEVAKTECADLIENFNNGNPQGRGSPCPQALDCLLDNTSESIKLNLASSQVLLGLTPAILSFAGSTIPEMAILATHRPLLAILMSIAAPAPQLRQLFSSPEIDTFVNRTPSNAVQAWHRWLQAQSRGMQVMMTCVLYFGVAAAVANCIHTSVYLAQRSVVGFACTSVQMPLAWVLLGLVPMLLSMGAMRQQYRLPTLRTFLKCGGCSATTKLEDDEEKTHRAAYMAELVKETPRGWVAELLFSAASIFALIQLVFGVAILSAVVPVSFFDALPLVLRYAAGNLLCRAILLIELDRIRIRILENKASGPP